MHWIAPSEKDTANAALEKRLWDAADQFRADSGLKSQEYSAPVLGLIFLRFAEVRFAAQRAKLEKASASARRGSRVHEPAAYHGEGILYLPVEARFRFLLNLAEAENIGAKVNAAIGGRAQAHIEMHNPQLASVLPKTYNLFTSTLLKELLKKVFENPATVDYDAFGRILEAMARALCREWFVHFRFPGHEKLPRVASPLGDIPHGWEVANLDAVKAERPHAINGGPFGSKSVSKDYVSEGIPVIRGNNLSESGRFDPTGFVFVSNEKAEELRANLARPGDIVVTQRGTLGQIGMIPSGIGYDRFMTSQSQMKITLNPKKVSREYVFFFLRSEEANQRIKNLASSSGVPHINLAVLREFQILLPPFEIQTKFGHFALGTEAAIEALLPQTQNLRRTRDLLLPRLLSGQVELASTNGEEVKV